MKDLEKRIKILKQLNVFEFDNLMEKNTGRRPSSVKVSLAAMHKARIYLHEQNDHFTRHEIQNSKNWLKANNMKED